MTGFADVLPAVANALLLAGLAWAVVTDLCARRISNRLTYPLMGAGFALNGIAAGADGLAAAFLGWAAGLALMLLPFLLGAMGAGDVKLMAAVGALKGPEFVLVALLYTCVAGGLFAIYSLARERTLLATFRFALYGWFAALRRTGPSAGAIPYAPAIAAGSVAALLLMPTF